MINDSAEKCQGCTLKHLTTALVWLEDTEHPEKLKAAYVCGNLAHAANHFVHYSQPIAEKIRQLRLNGINNNLTFAKPTDELTQELQKVLEEVSDYKEPEKSVLLVAPPETKTAQVPSKGCGCRKR